MANDIMNPQSLADTIRDRVRTQIVSVIPDEQIDNLIKKEWDTFFQKQNERWDQGHRISTTPFQDMVRKEMDKFIHEKITKAIETEMNKFNSVHWDNLGKKYIEEFVKGYAPMAMQGMALSMAEAGLRNVMNNMPQFQNRNY